MNPHIRRTLGAMILTFVVGLILAVCTVVGEANIALLVPGLVFAVVLAVISAIVSGILWVAGKGWDMLFGEEEE